MPLKVNVGLFKKLRLPDKGRLEVSCHAEFEILAGQLEGDLDGFHRNVRNAYTACRQAVQEEVDRQQYSGGESLPSHWAEQANGKGHASPANGNGKSGGSANRI